MPPEAETVLDRLESTRDRWLVFSLVSGIVLAVSISLVTLFLFVLTDVLVPLSQIAIVVLALVWIGVTVGLVATIIARLIRSQRSLEATARRVELDLPELGSNLINLVQFSESDNSSTGDFQRAAVTQAANHAAGCRFEHAARQESRWQRFVYCLQTPRDLSESCLFLAAVLFVAYGLHLFVPRWASSRDRLLHPWAFVPAVGAVKITEVTPGDTEILVGSSLEIAAEIDNPDGRSYPATLFVSRDGEPETAQPLVPHEDNQRFVAAFASVLKPMRYRLQIGDSQTQIYSVGVVEKPTVESVEVTYRYPAYLDRPKQTIQQKHGDLEAPQFTVAELRFMASTPIRDGFVRVEGDKVSGLSGSDSRSLNVRLLLTKNTTYTVHLENEHGHTDPDPRVNRVRVTPDAPPSVQLVKPAPESSASPGSEVAVIVRAADDYGIGRVWLEIKSADEADTDQPARTIQSWTEFSDPTRAVFRHGLVLDTEQFTPGQTVLVRAVAADRRNIKDWNGHVELKSQEAASAWHRIRVIAREAEAAASLAQLDAVRAALWKILEKQIRTRVTTSELAKRTTIAEAAKPVQEVRANQIEIQQATASLAESMGEAVSEERVLMKRAVSKLAFGIMLEAVRQAETVARVEEQEELAESAATLCGTQDRIIDALRRLLDAARRATADALTEMEKRPGGDLPSDVQDKLRELKDKLAEFLKQQKKIIEASENLAKMPVDDFTEKEEQLLKELAAAEDDWSRFMKEAHTDLSKLPEQDFANPSLLAELIEVQTELKMAEDALTKKAADIAVPLEQLGAEMAEELTTNIEKWLPDTPDRERWSQEEPITDDMKKAPMAELPRELEDLIGELMEQEEDLFDELEDISSSWADSIDKGAGWDAMDGPISNMSAKGVTGNRLPNTNEIGGRSGEGRSGKSSGEFVGEEAIGKGGRKTPSRLTPDANVKGQVKDVSKDPVGGATGGGKESGQGGEGLEGPVPNRPDRELQRLAGKQAALRNKAEGIDLQFQVHNYHRTDLNRLIDAMAMVERDLRTGRYRNALRQRDVLLDGLDRVKNTAEGEFAIRQDRTTNLPSDVQKEMLGSMQEPAPAGWEELNRQYFERLATGNRGETKQTQRNDNR